MLICTAYTLSLTTRHFVNVDICCVYTEGVYAAEINLIEAARIHRGCMRCRDQSYQVCAYTQGVYTRQRLVLSSPRVYTEGAYAAEISLITSARIHRGCIRGRDQSYHICAYTPTVYTRQRSNLSSLRVYIEGAYAAEINLITSARIHRRCIRGRD